ncbi:MAG: site-specific DNA-methyltransferase [Pseudonocardiaceae bacterium]
MPGVRLEWDGKTADVLRLRLPLQVVETVNASRADRGTLSYDRDSGDGWRNKLIWGDNLHVLASLAEELAGQVDLIYIDPPFDSRQDYKVRIAVGDGGDAADQDLAKLSSVLEEKAYRDTWGKGVESYLQMLYARLVLLRELLSDCGSLFLHLAPNVSHLARVLLDEIFGADNFRAEIIWQRTTAHSDTKDFGTIHDSILCFSKSERHLWNPQFRPYDESYIKSHYIYTEDDGRRYRLSDLRSLSPRPNLQYEWKGYMPHPNGWVYAPERMRVLHDQGRLYYPKDKNKRVFMKRYLDEMPGMPLGDVWDDLFPINPQAKERLGYDT